MKYIKKLAVALMAVTLTAGPAYSWDIKGAVNKITNTVTKTDDKNKDDKSSTPGIGDLISGVASAFGIGDEFQFEQLVGTWKYNKPAVQFKSDNLLMKAGGTAASSMVVEKLEPYYKMAGCDNMTLEIAADSTFSMTLKLGKIEGHISQSEDGKQIFFHFEVFKKINLGTMEAFITKKNNNEMEITYDVSGLVELLEKVGSMTQKSSINTVTDLLKQYDGITAGFDLRKQ